MFIAIWEFRVGLEERSKFEEVYGPEGRWARFFRFGSGFLGTRLLRDAEEPSRYLTVDMWTSQPDYDEFLKQREAEYKQIDRECEGLTETESKIGWFEEVGG